MSYWVSLIDPRTNQCARVERHREGGTYALVGTEEATLNVTYNWAPLFQAALNQAFQYLQRADPPSASLTMDTNDLGLRFLDRKRGDEVVPLLRLAVNYLGVERSLDYWAATKGNAGYCLNILLRWAIQHPNAVFEVH